MMKTWLQAVVWKSFHSSISSKVFPQWSVFTPRGEWSPVQF